MFAANAAPANFHRSTVSPFLRASLFPVKVKAPKLPSFHQFTASQFLCVSLSLVKGGRCPCQVEIPRGKR